MVTLVPIEEWVMTLEKSVALPVDTANLLLPLVMNSTFEIVPPTVSVLPHAHILVHCADNVALPPPAERLLLSDATGLYDFTASVTVNVPFIFSIV